MIPFILCLKKKQINQLIVAEVGIVGVFVSDGDG